MSHWTYLLVPLAYALAAFAVAAMLTPVMIRVAKAVGWVAEPSEDRWHREPTALMGGVAIFAAVSVTWAFLPAGTIPWSLWAGGAVMFATGLTDDIWGIAPVGKLVAQVGAAAALLVNGYGLELGVSAWLDVPLTFVWVIGITNAVNLLDNMDGLAAGIAGISAVALGGFALSEGLEFGAAGALALTGACAGFLVFNFKPAKIFMGDGGSLFLGFMVAAIALVFPSRSLSGTVAAVMVPAAVMAVPILDTTLVTVRRIARGQPISQGGKDHSSHRLVFLGLGERDAVLTLYAVSVLFSVLAWALHFMGVYLALSVITIAGVGLVVFGVFLGQVEVQSSRDTSALPAGNPTPDRPTTPTPLRAVLLNKRELALASADLLLVVSAFVIAHHLRFEDEVTAEMQDRIVSMLPLVAFLKLAVFWWQGLYQGVLRYAGSHELVKVGKASVLASLLLVAALSMGFRFEGVSRSVLIIDWLLTTFSLAALRGGLRGLSSQLHSRRTGGRRVLLYGAGDAGYLAIRELRQNPQLGLEPVGFLDDDEEKQGRGIQGVRVLGGREDLEGLLKQYDVNEVLITISDGRLLGREKVQEVCREAGVEVREMRLSFVDPPGQ